MIKKKLHFAFDKTEKVIFFKKKFLQKYKSFSPKKCDVIVVLGGDGFMLHTLKRLVKFKKPFYGMNRGTYGFLMNKLKINNLFKYISRSKKSIISPLQMESLNKQNLRKKAIAINEISLLRQSKQTAYLTITRNNKKIIKKLVGDGVLVSTPAGSTAYNLSAHGPILSLNSGKLAITPISPFRPRRWRGILVSAKSNILIKNLDMHKRPVSAVADNIEVRNIKTVRIKINDSIKFKLLYDRKNSLTKKNKLEQIRKQGK
jgi:NAD+ kinase